jgi:hypothetical protein
LSYLIFVGALVLIGPRPQELAERPAGGQGERASTSCAGGRSS